MVRRANVQNKGRQKLKKTHYWYIEDEVGPWGQIVGTKERGKVPEWARKEHVENQKAAGRSHVGVTKKYI